MSRLRARCPHCRTLTAVALENGYECHSCGASFPAGLIRVPRAWGEGGETMARAATLPLPYPDAVEVDAVTLAEQSVEVAASLPALPLVVGGCCCAHIGAVEGLALRHDRLGVVWLDAHGDLNTAETTPSGNLWGMPLRMILDGGTIAPSQAVLVGARNLDLREEEYLETSGLPAGEDAIDEALAGTEAIYIAFDCDVLDPAEGMTVFMPEPDGLSVEQVEEIFARALAGRALAGFGITGLAHDPANLPTLERLLVAVGL